MSGIEIDFETADRIAVAVMKDQLDYLRLEVLWFESDDAERRLIENEQGRHMWVHPEDYKHNVEELIPAMETLIKYFGGSYA